MELYIDDLEISYYTKNLHTSSSSIIVRSPRLRIRASSSLEQILKDKGIIFQEWEDKYLFEIMPKKDAHTLDRRYRIYTVWRFRGNFCISEI